MYKTIFMLFIITIAIAAIFLSCFFLLFVVRILKKPKVKCAELNHSLSGNPELAVAIG